MPGRPRIVVPGVPHHITQRGARKQTVFFTEEDYAYYKSLLGTFCARGGVSILAWCLMPNHVHVVAIPDNSDSLRAAFAPLNRTYAQTMNRREGWRGHLWQSRFASVPLDDQYAVAAMRYADLNPVRAGLVQHPSQYRWSSARAHAEVKSDGLTDLAACLRYSDDLRGLVESALEEDIQSRFRKHETSGLPLGKDSFLDRIAASTGSKVRPEKRGGVRRRS